MGCVKYAGCVDGICCIVCMGVKCMGGDICVFIAVCVYGMDCTGAIWYPGCCMAGVYCIVCGDDMGCVGLTVTVLNMDRSSWLSDVCVGEADADGGMCEGVVCSASAGLKSSSRSDSVDVSAASADCVF